MEIIPRLCCASSRPCQQLENVCFLVETEMPLKEVWGSRLNVYPLPRKRHWVFKSKTSDINLKQREILYEDFNMLASTRFQLESIRRTGPIFCLGLLTRYILMKLIFGFCSFLVLKRMQDKSMVITKVLPL